jgi:hypothetical protein
MGRWQTGSTNHPAICTQETHMPPPPPRRLSVIVGLFILTRTVMNVAFRMVYPFLPALARGVGVDVTLVAHAVTARNALGIAGPVLGSLGDVRGPGIGLLTGHLCPEPLDWAGRRGLLRRLQRGQTGSEPPRLMRL